MFDFRLEQRTVDIANSKGDASFDEVIEELASIDLVSVLDKSVKLIFQLGFKRIVPELIWDESTHSLVGKEHRELA